jgi:rfaE bifunctional protein nucleotidyltransferase chain/domain
MNYDEWTNIPEANDYSVKKNKKKIVFTNGCFDILHPGHVQYLEEARNKGDFLVVAMDTDEAVRKQKGSSRPVNTLEKRMTVIAALESVDLVTCFEKSNPIPIIKKLRPDILVKGGDWKITQILGAKEVMGWKGKVFSLPYLEGSSTSNIIKKIKGKKK